MEKCVVLVVEDEEEMAAYIGELLAKYQYSPSVFNEPEKALEFLAWNITEINLVISDIKMPGMDGFELSRQVAKLRDDLPVILLSGYSEHLPEGASLPNVKAVLEKPLLKTDLLQAIESVIKQCRQ